ncbi:MAG: DUF6367 family protein [Bacteroidota bacterium]
MDLKELKEIIREVVIETFEEFNSPFHIIVQFDPGDNDKLASLTEGKWKPSGYKDYWERLDQPKQEFDQRHVHVAKVKHIKAKNKQVSWNKDGTRHDKKSFNTNFNGIERAREIARKALGLPANAKLENLNNKSEGQLLLESIDYLPQSTSAFIFKFVNSNEKQILKS